MSPDEWLIDWLRLGLALIALTPWALLLSGRPERVRQG